MITEMKKRSYKQTARAQQQDQTRSKIVEAAMALHEEVGPRSASIKAIAERAGVQRLTVYRHFADEGELFGACSSRWLELNPPPEASAWQGQTELSARLTIGVMAFYAYYSTTQAMWAQVFRDLPEVPALAEPMAAYFAFMEATCADMGGEAFTEQAAFAYTLRHVLQFATWQSLAEQGLTDADKVALVNGWLTASLNT